MIDWSTTALVFPGQGSQQVGMGKDLYDRYPVAKQVIDEADSVYDDGFSKLLFDGPAETLDQTTHTQPALYVVGVALLRVLESRYGPFAPLTVAGHSLGEFTALTAAGALSYAHGLRLVRERARLMHETGQRTPGSMAALLGAELDDTRTICEQASAETRHSVVIANDNCPGQVVISGETVAIDRAMELAKAHGIRRIVRLAVSIATHSPLMAQAAEAFRTVLDATPFQDPIVPVIGNLTAAPLHNQDEIRAELSAQLTHAVRWRESVAAMKALGAKRYFELGPKDVLTGLLKRIDRDAVGSPVNSVAGIEALAEQ